MRRLTETDGLTEFQRDILRAVRDFVDAEVIGVATELDHADAYPDRLVTRLKELGGKIRKMGYKGVDTTELILDDCRVPAGRVLGEAPGRGFYQMMDGIEVGRVNVAARGCGVALPSTRSKMIIGGRLVRDYGT